MSIAQSIINVKIKDNLDNILKLLENNCYIMYNNFYTLDIYMINKFKNEKMKLKRIKKLTDFNDYAVINDTNGIRKVTLHQDKEVEAKVYSIFLIKDLLYHLGYLELFNLNQEHYEYKFTKGDINYTFSLVEVRNQGLFLRMEKNDHASTLIDMLRKIGIKMDTSSMQVDHITIALANLKKEIILEKFGRGN